MDTIKQKAFANLSTSEFVKPVKVYLRARPLLDKEINAGDRNILNIFPADKQVLVDCNKGIFTFDGVFTETNSQKDIFDQVISELLPLMKNGHNVTVIAYGQTGSGKTYSMGTSAVSSQENEGILQRSVRALLKNPERSSTPTNESTSRKKYIKMEFLELYNDSLYDLFASRAAINVRPDGIGGVIPSNCQEETASTIDEALNILHKGNALRKTAQTAMNYSSSRSHALISLSVVSKNDIDCPSGCLRLVDLAGAEGVGRNHMEGTGFSEGVAINKGLLAIGKVLSALSSKASHVPYRDAVITQLLRDSLGGSSHTAMIACVSPSSSDVSITLNTLNYAEQTRNIKNKTAGMSTIKRKGVKRSNEDISATPGAWKKFMSGAKRPDHNNTLSTPGHRPPIYTQKMNNTFVTPLNRMSEVSRLLPVTSSQCDLTAPTPQFPPLQQPIFEEDSPTQSIIEPLPLSSTISVSPFVERVNARLEQSMMQYEEKIQKQYEERLNKQMRVLGDQITQKLYRTLMKGGSMTSRKSKRLMEKQKCTGNSPSETSVKDENEQPPVSRESLDTYPSLADAIVRALSEKQGILNSIFTEKESCVCNQTLNHSVYHQKYSRQPFQEVSAIKNETGQWGKNVPVTSTGICTDRVRRSLRLSQKISSLKSLYNISSCTDDTFDQDCSNSSKSDEASGNATVIRNDLSPVLLTQNQTLLEQTVTTPMIQPCNQLDIGRSAEEVTECTVLRNICNASVIGSAPTNLRRSSRRSALYAIQKNHELLSHESPLNTRRKTAKKISNSILNGSVCKRGQQTCSLSTSKQTAEGKLELIISPTLKKKQEHDILNVLNKGSLRELQKLPTVGPKTAMVLHNFRMAFGKFRKVADLENVPALPKSYYSRFMKANLVSQINFK